jgi:hypothetical protein
MAHDDGRMTETCYANDIRRRGEELLRWRTINCLMTINYRLILLLTHVISCTLKMETTCSSEATVYNKPTRPHIPETGILVSPRRENLKAHIAIFFKL